jgi:ribosomal protein S6
MKYELFYLVGVSKETELEKIKTEVKKIVLEEGGVFEEKEVIEKRKLSYAVKHETHGIYVAQRFEIEEGEKLQGITRKINLRPDVLRFLISRADELPPLRTKEERIREVSAPVQEIKPLRNSSQKPEVKVSPEVKPDEKAQAEKEKTESQDIDKRLEEILNI